MAFLTNKISAYFKENLEFQKYFIYLSNNKDIIHNVIIIIKTSDHVGNIGKKKMRQAQ